jgi:GNAT superfamily N-acetyltransferase
MVFVEVDHPLGPNLLRDVCSSLGEQKAGCETMDGGTDTPARLRIRPATTADLPRIGAVRHGTAENRLLDPARVTTAEIGWYLTAGIFLVSEDEADIQGFTCANHQTGYIWALFVIDDAQGRGHGTHLLDAALARLREAGHRQAFLTTGSFTKAEGFYQSKGWHCTGTTMNGDRVYRIWL